MQTLQNNKTIKVSKLNNFIKNVFEDEFILHNIYVEGELTEYKISGSNAYFTLSDEESSINCVIFSTNEKFEVGQSVLVFGTVKYYSKSGKISFVAKSIKDLGRGNKQTEFLLLKEKLESEGFFANKKPLPFFIKNVALITSDTGAVIHDFISVLDKNFMPSVYVFPVKVQGINSDIELVNAIKLANEIDYSFDVILIARGGGSSEDLETFNSEKLVRAVNESKIPIISAIGHEIDVTLCDLCADVRAGTPSIAGEIVNKNRQSVYNQFYLLTDNLVSGIDRILVKKEKKVVKNTNKVVYYLDNKSNAIQSRINLSINNIYDNVYNTQYKNYLSKIQLLSAKLDSKSPLKLLSKGYAKILVDNKSVNSIEQINNDDIIDIYLKDGNIKSKVIDKIKKGN